MQRILISEPAHPANYAFIWLHGLGASANDFFEMSKEWQHMTGLPLRGVFPDAPQRPVTCNGNLIMPAWYDIANLDLAGRDDKKGLQQTAAFIDNLIQQQVAQGIPTQRIFLGGYSQGCAAALFTGLRYPQPLAGIIGFSGYLPAAASLTTEANPANFTTPIFLAHGNEDPVVHFEWGEQTYKLLQQHYAVTWKVYRMGHQVSPQEIYDAAMWLKQQAK